MIKVGLTGGIGSGKTTVANYFQALGVEVIDADVIAKELTRKNKTAYEAILNRYGLEVLTEDRELDRQKIRALIFESPIERQWLEDLLHPLIKLEIQHAAASCKSQYCIVSIPLLVETQAYDLVDRVLLVDSTEAHQIERTATRDGISQELISAILNQQATREQRLEVADDILYNDTDLNCLKTQINDLHRFYLELAKRGC